MFSPSPLPPEVKSGSSLRNASATTLPSLFFEPEGRSLFEAIGVEGMVEGMPLSLQLQSSPKMQTLAEDFLEV